MKPDELEPLAEKFIREIERLQRIERPLPSVEDSFFELTESLEHQGLLSSRSEHLHMFALRFRVSGSPILLDRSNNEILLKSLGFAIACFNILKKKNGGDISLLHVLM